MINYKTFQFYCDHCHWKRITDGENIKDLYEIPTSKLQNGVPKLDPETKKTVNANFVKQKRKFRCPSCGHTVTPRLIPDPQKNYEEKTEIEKRSEERKKLEESILMRDRQKKDGKD